MSTLARRALLITAALSVISCAHAETVTGSGRIVTETRSVSGFEAVQLEASMKLVLRQGTQEAVQVQADDNLVPLIETLVETRGSLPTLVVRWKRNTSIRSHQAIVVTVDAVRVRALSASGSGSIEAATLKTDRLRIERGRLWRCAGEGPDRRRRGRQHRRQRRREGRWPCGTREGQHRGQRRRGPVEPRAPTT